MKRAVSQRISKVLAVAILATFSNVLLSSPAHAAQYLETFGSGTCGIQTSGLTIVQNGVSISSNSAVNGNATISTTYGTSFGMSGCNINLQYPTTSVIVTFPVASQPTQFSFYAGAVDAGKVHLETVTYTDNSYETFTVKNTDPNAGETVTVLGNGKLIASFTLNPYLSGADYWFLDNLRWSTGLNASSSSVSPYSSKAFKGLIDTLTATSSIAGKITFTANGKRISNCISIPIATSVNCLWEPSVQGSVVVGVIFKPTDSSYGQSSASANVTVIKRTNTR
jgi:hypothetical protein